VNERHLEGSVLDHVKVLSRKLSVGNEENRDNHSSLNTARDPTRDLKRVPPVGKYTALLLGLSIE
jgi:hypothetical protein